MVQIEPAILETTEEGYAQTVTRLNAAPSLEGATIQIDFADGQFVDNKTAYWAAIEKYPLNFDREAHLMVQDPKSFITRLSLFKFKRVLVHVESQEVDHALEMILSRHMEAGLVLNPDSSIESARPYLSLVSLIQLMGIYPGHQGLDFRPETLDRIKELIEMRGSTGSDFQIAVDGGITPEVAAQLAKAGVDVLVIGSHLVKGDVEDNLEQIWEVIHAD